MGNLNREDLINSLAMSMGVNNSERVKLGESYYDPSTGTLYCKGMAITKNAASEAQEYFMAMESKCNISDPDSRKMALMYRCAIEAITLMQDPDVIEVIKNKAEKSSLN